LTWLIFPFKLLSNSKNETYFLHHKEPRASFSFLRDTIPDLPSVLFLSVRLQLGWTQNENKTTHQSESITARLLSAILHPPPATNNWLQRPTTLKQSLKYQSKYIWFKFYNLGIFCIFLFVFILVSVEEIDYGEGEVCVFFCSYFGLWRRNGEELDWMSLCFVVINWNWQKQKWWTWLPRGVFYKLTETETEVFFCFYFVSCSVFLVLELPRGTKGTDEWSDDCLVIYVKRDVFNNIDNNLIIQRFQYMSPRSGQL
jgi:hypothetical protein